MSNGLINDMDSCELCKLRKVKCDRVEPTCGWCARNDRVCEYKERKKPGLRAGYGRELEGRIDRLEALIHAQGSRLEDHIHKHDASNPMQSTTLSGDASTEASRYGDCSYGVIPKGPRHASVVSSGWPQVHGSEHGQYGQQPEGVFWAPIFAKRESVVRDSIFCSAYLPSILFTYRGALSVLVLVLILIPGVFHMSKLTPQNSIS